MRTKAEKHPHAWERKDLKLGGYKKTRRERANPDGREVLKGTIDIRYQRFVLLLEARARECIWSGKQIYLRSESECAQAMRRRARKCLSHYYTTRSYCDLRAARAKGD